jgi:L-alanine-DL-glutamate epimerase-like enolase superfamily enzyme
MIMDGRSTGNGPHIDGLRAAVYRIPTDRPESDGTLQWDATTMVAVHVRAGGREGFGYSYTDAGAAQVVMGTLAPVVQGLDALDVPRAWSAMKAAIRNLGRSGIAAMAVAAVDAALWDLKARLLDLPLVTLLGRSRDAVEVYGSGGFTSYDDQELRDQLGGWAADGIGRVKMKIGRDAARDPERIRAARDAIGANTGLFVDANGGYGRKLALAMADVLAEYGVTWYEEPVSQHDETGLRFIRERVPAAIEVTAGEYGFVPDDFQRLLAAGSVDVLMADATRCGLTGLMEAAALCTAYHCPLSAHCAPALHLHPCCALAPVRHIEYFHDHVRIERMLLDGISTPVQGKLIPDLSRPGHGLALKESDARPFALS